MGNDLKIIFYIIVAIVWVVYNNYRKIAGESRKRNPSKPPGEVIRENWPTLSGEQQDRSVTPPPTVVRDPLKRSVTTVTVPARTKPVRTAANRRVEEIMTTTSMLSPAAEGGRTKPSGMVHFEEPAKAPGERVSLIEQLRYTDLQTAFLWSEIFKNPYNQSFEAVKDN